MKFLRYAIGDIRGLAVAEVGEDFKGYLETDANYPGDLTPDLIERVTPEELSHTLSQGSEVTRDEITYLPPFSGSEKIICIGLNYFDHSMESGFNVPDYPTVFARFESSLIAHADDLILPRASEQFDYEGELALVVGRTGKRIPREEALQYVFGYSIFNDASVRDFQLRTPQWTVGKNFDGTGAFGPLLVTPEELAPGCAGAGIRTRLNGHIVQSANIDDLIFGVADLISDLSQAMTLRAGDLIITGTPAGVGAGRKPPLWLKAGDLCEVEIDGIGKLQNRVRAEAV